MCLRLIINVLRRLHAIITEHVNTIDMQKIISSISCIVKKNQRRDIMNPFYTDNFQTIQTMYINKLISMKSFILI